MMKSMIFNLTLIYPLMINISIMMMMMMPCKINKFHPMMLMLILISLTILISLKMNFMYNSWLPYITFLIMIGGLMIIYMYISSLSNNELFMFNYPIMKSNWKIKILLIMYMYMYIKNNQYFNLMDSWNNYFNITYDQLNISIMYQKINNNASYFIMWYLYFTMICVMNICYKNKLPLRQLNS